MKPISPKKQFNFFKIATASIFPFVILSARIGFDSESGSNLSILIVSLIAFTTCIVGMIDSREGNKFRFTFVEGYYVIFATIPTSFVWVYFADKATVRDPSGLEAIYAMFVIIGVVILTPIYAAIGFLFKKPLTTSGNLETHLRLLILQIQCLKISRKTGRKKT